MMWDDILDEIAEESTRRGGLPEPTPALLRQIWPTLAGSSLAAISRPLRLDGGVLSMEVRDQELIDEWRRSSTMLLRRLRRFCPWKLDELTFVHNPRLQAPEAAPEPVTEDESGGPVRPEAASDAPGAVADPELQSIIDSIDRLRTDDGLP